MKFFPPLADRTFSQFRGESQGGSTAPRATLKIMGLRPLVNIEQGTARSTSLEAVEIFDAGAGVENDHALADFDLAGRAQSF
jgi:hypothetical protein